MLRGEEAINFAAESGAIKMYTYGDVEGSAEFPGPHNGVYQTEGGVVVARNHFIAPVSGGDVDHYTRKRHLQGVIDVGETVSRVEAPDDEESARIGRNVWTAGIRASSFSPLEMEYVTPQLGEVEHVDRHVTRIDSSVTGSRLALHLMELLNRDDSSIQSVQILNRLVVLPEPALAFVAAHKRDIVQSRSAVRNVAVSAKQLAKTRALYMRTLEQAGGKA